MTHRRLDPPRFRFLARAVSRIALVDPRQFHRVARCLLDRIGEVADLSTLLRIRRRDPQGQQVPERVDGGMDLGALGSLVAVVARAVPALRCAAHRPCIQHDRGRVGSTPRRLAQQRAQIVDHVLEAPGRDPALCLLVDGGPRREVRRQVAPGGAGPHDPAEGVEDLAQVVPALGRVRRHQREVGRHKRPLLVRHVTRIGLAGLVHLLSLRPGVSP